MWSLKHFCRSLWIESTPEGQRIPREEQKLTDRCWSSMIYKVPFNLSYSMILWILLGCFLGEILLLGSGCWCWVVGQSSLQQSALVAPQCRAASVIPIGHQAATCPTRSSQGGETHWNLSSKTMVADWTEKRPSCVKTVIFLPAIAIFLLWKTWIGRIFPVCRLDVSICWGAMSQ